MPEPYDLVVIGAGSGGITTARTAAGLGGRVLLVEAARTVGRFGCPPEEPKVDFTAVMEHVRRAQEHIEPVDSPVALRSAPGWPRRPRPGWPPWPAPPPLPPH